jgi:hypothetical protein
MLYSNFMPPAKVKARLASKLTGSSDELAIPQHSPAPEIVEEVSKKPIAAHSRHLVFEVVCSDPNADDDDADAPEPEVPFILYKLPRA